MTTLFAKLTDLLTTNLASLALVDLNTGQVNRVCPSSPIPTPAVLLKFASQSIDEIDSRQDLVSVQITASVVVDNSNNTTTAQTALQNLTIIGDVVKSLRGYNDSQITNLTRVSSIPEDRADCLFVHNVVFTGNYIETFE